MTPGPTRGKTEHVVPQEHSQPNTLIWLQKSTQAGTLSSCASTNTANALAQAPLGLTRRRAVNGK